MLPGEILKDFQSVISVSCCMNVALPFYNPLSWPADCQARRTKGPDKDCRVLNEFNNVLQLFGV